MRDQPPEALVDLLGRLHLASRQQVQAVASRARYLAGELPMFDSVWIDALAQARLLTPYQAAELNAGRGEQLLVGGYRIQKPIQRLGYADCFLATEMTGAEEKKKKLSFPFAGRKKAPGVLPHDNNNAQPPQQESCHAARTKQVHLLVVRNRTAMQAEGAAEHLRSISPKMAMLDQAVIKGLQAVGSDDKTVWAAYSKSVGFPALDWLACQGRLPPLAVMEVARQMVAALAKLESIALAHGDISALTLWLSESGSIEITACGARIALRRIESERLETLPLEALDYLSPESLTDGVADCDRSTVIELYACGCLWWHMLAGRPPVAGGDYQTKVAAIRRGNIPNIRLIAPDTPLSLAAAIENCTRSNPLQRPRSFTQLAEQLGSPTVAGRRRLTSELLRSGRHTIRPNLSARLQTGLSRAAQPLLAATACAFLLAAATWPLWRPRPLNSEHQLSSAKSVGAENIRHEMRISSAEHHADFAATLANQLVAKSSESDESMAADRKVRQVNYQSIEPLPTPAKTAAGIADRPLIELAGKAEIAGASLRLTAGALVRGSAQTRPLIVVPPGGLKVTVENVRWENVDFVWRARTDEMIGSDRSALINLHVAHAEFAGCTFQATGADLPEMPVAIRLVGAGKSAALAPATQLKLDRCFLTHLSCGIDCSATGPVAIDLGSTLYLATGTLVRFATSRPVEAPAEIMLDHTTVRGAMAVLELNGDNVADGAGLVNITVNNCVFAPAAEGALMALASRSSPKSISLLLKSITWTGRGSLADSHAAVLQRLNAAARENLSDDELELDGLVSSKFEFAGLATADPATSRVVKWLAPLESDQPPGIGDNLPRLPPANSP